MRNLPAVPLATGLTLEVSAGIEEINQPLLPLLEAWMNTPSWPRLKHNWLDCVILKRCISATTLASQFEQLL